DLPAMDDDDFRRGQPSSHKKYGEATAILVGDLLQALSFEFLAMARLNPKAMVYFARAVGTQGMVAGQFMDMQASSSNTLRMHQLKTGRLIEAAVVLPFFIGENKIPLSVVRWARALGLLFQITDDLLDGTQSSSTLGKTAGKDLAQNKKTIVALLGQSEAEKRAALLSTRLENQAKQIFTASAFFASLPSFLLHRKS
ncbi:MAG TPA: polyprenyl synthetase family protein, partial [Turneriella sp.]|nr:polyprenyl synthetase family protein [Turneriella sp.]